MITTNPKRAKRTRRITKAPVAGTGKRSAPGKEARALIRDAKAMGYHLVPHRKHLVFRHSTKRVQVVAAMTPSDHRSYKNVRATLRRSLAATL